MKYLTDQFQLCVYFYIGNTIETETSLKFQDRELKFETETRGFKFCGFCQAFQKNVVTTSQVKLLWNFWHFSYLFSLFLPTR